MGLVGRRIESEHLVRMRLGASFRHLEERRVRFFGCHTEELGLETVLHHIGDTADDVRNLGERITMQAIFELVACIAQDGRKRVYDHWDLLLLELLEIQECVGPIRDVSFPFR